MNAESRSGYLLPQTTVQGYPVQLTGRIPRSIQGMQALITWRNEHAEAPDSWLRQDICTVFQFMIGLNLGKPPAAELMPITAETWVEIIGEGMTEDIDRERIRAAFKVLRRGLKWWPQPADLLKVLPRRIAPPTESYCDTPLRSRQTDEEHARTAAEFEKLLGSLGSQDLVSKMTVKSSSPLDRAGIEKMKNDFMKAHQSPTPSPESPE